ncbi:hypothetical protein V6U71_04895 [Sphingopyxis sp. J-6]|uniref:hypothetical protein n=1 Tax=Sphingopyxis sp. J-6 TaxID=3122054 RepID=UPI003983F440
MVRQSTPPPFVLIFLLVTLAFAAWTPSPMVAFACGFVTTAAGYSALIIFLARRQANRSGPEFSALAVASPNPVESGGRRDEAEVSQATFVEASHGEGAYRLIEPDSATKIERKAGATFIRKRNLRPSVGDE